MDDVNFSGTVRSLRIELNKKALLDGRYDVIPYAEEKTINHIIHRKNLFDWCVEELIINFNHPERVLYNYLFDLVNTDLDKFYEWFLENVEVVDYAMAEYI